MKSLFKVVVLSLCLLMAVSFTYAGNGKGSQDGSGQKNTEDQRGPNYVDQNGDGICDNSDSRISRCGRGRGAGNQGRGRSYCGGLRDGRCPGNREGVSKSNYVDENGDGICDNFQTKSPSK
ncbi:MAG: hypothetical protein Q7J15_03835 [Candidatus Desulfaltia sp.]|nr:hypothetical protein [Candidatus Desulfaltia sp.]